MHRSIRLAIITGLVLLPSLALAQSSTPADTTGMAFAATDQGWIKLSTSYVCQDDGAVLNAIFHYLWPFLGIPFFASLLSNFRSKLSPAMNAALDVATGDIAAALKAKALTAAAAAPTAASVVAAKEPPAGA